MDRFVADPHWGDLITWYFFLGGIAAGSYAMAMLAALFGDESDRRATRAAYYLAFPLVCVCGVLLIVDLGRPERFWHMLIQSRTGRPMFKWWSPMSVGSWGLSAFGAFSFASFLGVLAEDGWLGPRWGPLAARLGRGWVGTLFQVGGALAGFFLGSYTGALLTATNQPVWASTTWIAPLFLASSASTGIAAMVLLAHWRPRDAPRDALGRLEWLDLWAIALELAMLAILGTSLAGEGLARYAFTGWPGLMIPAFVVPVGLVLPLVLKVAAGPRGVPASSLLVLLGGFTLRAAVVGIPRPLLVGA